jgi:hypothetical protein
MKLPFEVILWKTKREKNPEKMLKRALLVKDTKTLQNLTGKRRLKGKGFRFVYGA